MSENISKKVTLILKVKPLLQSWNADSIQSGPFMIKFTSLIYYSVIAETWGFCRVYTYEIAPDLDLDLVPWGTAPKVFILVDSVAIYHSFLQMHIEILLFFIMAI